MPVMPAFLDKKTKIKYQKHLQENDTLVTFNSPRSHFHGEYYEDNNRCRKINFCSGELTKLGHLLSVLNQAVNDNNCENDDIEGCLGIAWDLVKSMQSTIKSNNPEIAK